MQKSLSRHRIAEAGEEAGENRRGEFARIARPIQGESWIPRLRELSPLRQPVPLPPTNLRLLSPIRLASDAGTNRFCQRPAWKVTPRIRDVLSWFHSTARFSHVIGLLVWSHSNPHLVNI